MPFSTFEIVMLPNGDVVLQRDGHSEESIVRISFSKVASSYLQGAQLEVAKAMINAGIDAIEMMGSIPSEDTGGRADKPGSAATGRVLH